MKKRVSIKIKGIVQGVGFRPTVYRYAIEFKLSGWVKNDTNGVFIEVEGPSEQVDAFINKLQKNPPPMAEVESFLTTEIPLVNNLAPPLLNSKSLPIDSTLPLFNIILSETETNTDHSSEQKTVEISPDLATCTDCLAEIFDPLNRRYQYPFTNCTNCGPRFTIIKDRPYDRHLTSMADFPMCPECKSEYENPLDRRFHAQPNACPICGPKLSIFSLTSPSDRMLTPLLDKDIHQNAIQFTAQELLAGKIIGIKGLGGFNIAVLAHNHQAVNRLRVGKKRPHRSFALMMRNIDTIKKYCFVNEEEIALLKSPAAPIVLLRKNSPHHILDHISPDNNYLGVMLPYTPLHHLLMASLEVIIMTSANLAEEPMAICDQEMENLLKLGIIDLVLSHNREIINRCDDSIVQVVNGKILTIRRSRGFTPKSFSINKYSSIDINKTPPSCLALGANMKNTFALRRGAKVYLSQHIGDLEDYRNYEYQSLQISSLKKLLDIDSQTTAGDAHPGYETYEQAEHKIFHHHAHVLSVMVEHNLLSQTTLGVVADGTGFGEDNNIWGFEFLLVGPNYTQFKRLGHLRYFHLPGGEEAIHNIDRIGISLLYQSEININNVIDSNNLNDYSDLNELNSVIHFKNYKIITDLIKKNFNAPLTSSLGRLFDGVSAILGLTDRSASPSEDNSHTHPIIQHTRSINCQVEYEAQGAILLQKAAEDYIALDSNSSDQNKLSHLLAPTKRYPVTIIGSNSNNTDNHNHSDSAIDSDKDSNSENSKELIIDFVPLIRAMILDLKNENRSKEEIAYFFHIWVVDSILAVLRPLLKLPNLSNIALSGGCFQNQLLTSMLENELKKLLLSYSPAIKICRNQYSPINDAGIALGQCS